MKIAITGSHSIKDYRIIRDAIKASGYEKLITEIVSGHGRGTDRLAEKWANERNIPVRKFLPDWKKHGQQHAIFMRNKAIVNYSDVLVVVWDGTKGRTKNLISLSEAKGIKVFYFITNR